MNVIGSRPTGWWRDRAGAVRSLVERLAMLADRDGDEVVVVVDGRPQADPPEGRRGRVEVRYAPGGPDAADHRIVDLVAADADPASLVVVTADRALVARVQAAGAEVAPPSALLRRLDALGS